MALITESDRKEILLAIEENKLLDELYDHQGMKILTDKMQEMVDEYDRLDSIKDINDLYFKKGQIDILKWVIGYQPLIRQALEHSLEEAEKIISASLANKRIAQDD